MTEAQQNNTGTQEEPPFVMVDRRLMYRLLGTMNHMLLTIRAIVWCGAVYGLYALAKLFI